MNITTVTVTPEKTVPRIDEVIEIRRQVLMSYNIDPNDVEILAAHTHLAVANFVKAARA